MEPETIAFFNSNDGSCLLAIGKNDTLRIDTTKGDSLTKLQEFIDKNAKRYIVTALSYDLKNELEDLASAKPERTGFPLLLAWVPEYFIEISKGKTQYLQGNEDDYSKSILNQFIHLDDDFSQYLPPVFLLPRTDKSDYLKHVKLLKDEIQHGNIYEVNYCQEYYSENVMITDPLQTYKRLNEITRAPFSVYLNVDEFNVFCGSPERFIQRTVDKIVSQPIKGTIKRGKSTDEDEALKEKLRNDPKERSENVMIVDLVRNDLSRIARKNSVKVDELFGIYTFKTVHQMISTVSCEVDDVSFTDVIRASFPMGSMTGAPKISAMKLIEEHEDFCRGLYSGSIGYIQPSGDFNLNVVIRTMIYNSKNKYLSCPVGGAITIQSDPESEYEECETKIRKILNGMNA